ncbi:hypothetical protein PPTG_00554 [Phytophthora nicotianae INRA-310]|uniref:Uncharacterized protein n=1 Tax=Phytophthora nicotianae (strain INRA-310) TaxID=761204 RepID=W2RF89_PHYN3|nr:hypothetical protein PPTG_00554 [Phytophthora nicotianae INRA-310]ETN24113.1 hypothetical protein PPTG_00554 [Phytophthora nicotianae INRA-310]
MSAKSGSTSTEKEEGLEAIKSQTLAKSEMPRVELTEVSSRHSPETLKGRASQPAASLTLKLNKEREPSRAHEQDLEDTTGKLDADASRHRKQQLQSILQRFSEVLVQAANASGESEVAQEAVVSDDGVIAHHFDAVPFCA